MKLQQIVSAARAACTHAKEAAKRADRLEWMLAAVCLLIPVLLVGFDDGRIRGSVSEYYDMEENQIFYFFLTVAAMLFVVNGVRKEKKFFNIILGVMLACVILFNRDDASLLHSAFAIAFFGGNAVVIVLYTSKEVRWFKILFVVGIALSMLGYFLFDWFTLFWAQWLSFTIIGLHYILESWASLARARVAGRPGTSNRRAIDSA